MALIKYRSPAPAISNSICRPHTTATFSCFWCSTTNVDSTAITAWILLVRPIWPSGRCRIVQGFRGQWVTSISMLKMEVSATQYFPILETNGILILSLIHPVHLLIHLLNYGQQSQRLYSFLCCILLHFLWKSSPNVSSQSFKYFMWMNGWVTEWSGMEDQKLHHSICDMISLNDCIWTHQEQQIYFINREQRKNRGRGREVKSWMNGMEARDFGAFI